MSNWLKETQAGWMGNEPVEYTFTACVAAWYAQIMAMVGIVVFTVGIGYLFKSLFGYLHLGFSYGPSSFPILDSQGSLSRGSLEQQRQVDLLVRAPSFLVGGPVIYFVYASLSRTVSVKHRHAPDWVRRGSQLVQTVFLGTVSTFSSLIALNLLLGYLLIPSPSNQPAAPFGEMLGCALAFIGAFVAHIMIWRSYPGGTWCLHSPRGRPGRTIMSRTRNHMLFAGTCISQDAYAGRKHSILSLYLFPSNIFQTLKITGFPIDNARFFGYTQCNRLRERLRKRLHLF